jgi:hypothetical protein
MKKAAQGPRFTVKPEPILMEGFCGSKTFLRGIVLCDNMVKGIKCFFDYALCGGL